MNLDKRGVNDHFGIDTIFFRGMVTAQLEPIMNKTLTRQEVTDMVRALVVKNGGAIKLAKKLDVTQGYISHLVNGKKPGPKVCALLGISEVKNEWRRVK